VTKTNDLAIGDEPLGLTGVQKAAALLLAGGKTCAARLLRHLDPADLRSLTEAATKLGFVPRAKVDTIFRDFEAAFVTGADLVGGLDETRKLLIDAIPEKEADTIISDVMRGGIIDVWEALRARPEAEIASSLADEHPLIACHLLSKLDSSVIAKIVAAMPRAARNEVLCRMIAPAEIGPGAASVVERALRAHFGGGVQKAQAASPRPQVAQILNSLEPADQQDAMGVIAKASQGEALELKKLLFSFDDLVNISPRGRALVFDKISTDLVVLSLRGAAPEFREAVLSSMASRSRRLVESELNGGASPPAREIARARKEIVDVILGMSQRGEIELTPTERADAA